MAPGSGNSSITPEMLLAAYRQGYFPMANGPKGSVGFYAYEPRGVIPLDDRFQVRRSLKQVMNKGKFEIRINTAFDEVIRTCARHQELPNNEVWLSEHMIPLYEELHQRSIAHSVETWITDNSGEVLVGGLYGLSIGGAFCGESMFSKVPFASQVALVALVDHLRKRGFTLLDAQMSSEHLKQFGLIECTHEEYMELFNQALQVHAAFI